ASWKESGNERHVTAYDVADMKSSAPESLPVKTGDHYSSLRHKRYPLPFTLRLKEFKVEFHPGTDVAKSYESAVEIIKPDAKRDARIYMNNPLRDKDYTFYQASYDIDAMGRKYSTLAVVRNAGRILPYIACFTVFLGLTVHFLMAAFRRKRI
ncbi:MAG: cytochrome c biogenesis protein ResB, partial [Candidatus Omnitrophica bacterium]|nr:cytochrome c biogenesis protein ResB [Candidatus Omnitrophota bacterium]